MKTDSRFSPNHGTLPILENVPGEANSPERYKKLQSRSRCSGRKELNLAPNISAGRKAAKARYFDLSSAQWLHEGFAAKRALMSPRPACLDILVRFINRELLVG